MRRFHRGRRYYKRRKRSNALVAKIELEKFFDENSIVGMRETEEWPKRIRYFESKLITHFQTNLKIFLPNRVTEVYKTPKEFIDHVSDADIVLKLIENDENDKYIEQDTDKIMIRNTKTAYKYLFNFLINYVPSDLYKDSMNESSIFEE